MSLETPLLTVHGLRVDYGMGRYRLCAVRDVSFALRPGRIFGVLGESGCGKTSLARAILGLEPIAAGRVYFGERELTSLRGNAERRARRGMQHVFQDPASSLSPRRSVFQTLEEPLRHYRIGDRPERHRRVVAALDRVGLGPELLRRYPHELSGGQRQRIALARALVADPLLIVADEPMAALDVSAQARIVELMRRARDETNVAFLLIAHDLAVVGQLADDVGVMYLGRLVESGTARAVFDSPAHPYTRALIEAARGRRTPDGRHAVLEGEPPSPLTPPSGCVFHTRCREVMDRCPRAEPPAADVTAGDDRSPPHTVRCHLCS